MRQHPLFYLESLDRRIAKRAKFWGTSGTFLNSRNPKLVVIGILLHIGSGVLAPAGSFFAKKNRRCTNNQCVAASFSGATLSTPPFFTGPGSAASASLSARCFEPPATKGQKHAVLLSDSEVGTGSEHRDHAALIFIRHELADLFGRQSLHKRLNLRVLFMSLTGGHHHGIGARLTLKIDRVRHRV